MEQSSLVPRPPLYSVAALPLCNRIKRGPGNEARAKSVFTIPMCEPHLISHSLGHTNSCHPPGFRDTDQTVRAERNARGGEEEVGGVEGCREWGWGKGGERESRNKGERKVRPAAGREKERKISKGKMVGGSEAAAGGMKYPFSPFCVYPAS